MDVAGVRLIGLGADAGHKLLLTLALVGALVVVRMLISAVTRRATRTASGEQRRFWTRQVVSLVLAALLLFGVLSIWFDDPARLGTVLGLVSAGVAIALQRVITSFAAYVIILRSRVFSVGDRITMGGVRGDVVSLGFMQTSVMEMGEPPDVQQADPAVWVRSRQYTGRVVRITNDKIFDTPIYNYTREFPFVWEEMHLPITYAADRARAEAILLDVARRHTSDTVAAAVPALEELRKRYFLRGEAELEPSVYWRLTDNWLELTVRFVAPTHGIRRIKNAMSRDILAALDEAKIGIASATYDIVGLPEVRVRLDR